MASNKSESNDSLWLVTKISILTFIAAVGLLIFSTVLSYFPPRFTFGFLEGRASYFYGWYAIAFYIHVTSATASLFLGIIQQSQWIRSKAMRLHRLVGTMYVALTLVAVSPSGLVIAIKATDGALAATAFIVLSIATFTCTLQGYRTIRQRRIAHHQIWMMRSFLLMCSAVALRFLAALVRAFDVGDYIRYGWLAWLSWLPMLIAYELWLYYRSVRRVDARGH